MMNDRKMAARALYDVYQGAPLITPLRTQFNCPDIETAYAIQEINTRLWLKEGRTLTGRKIGLTSKVVQEQLGVDQPDYGMLFDDMLVKNDREVAFDAVCQPKIEGEVAFILDKDITGLDLTEKNLAAAIDYAVPALEIVGSRIHDWDISIFDTVADNASSGLYVLGAARVPLTDIDLIGCEMTLQENGEVVSTGKGAACLGSPLIAALWLAKKMVEVGRPLKAGDVIMSGALGPMVIVKPGAEYYLSVSGLDTVSVKFGE
ncbi:MAG: 2-keto-4-pentenoate hydratase [Alphaproteobacteria bacterium]|nr:MAG: 2-keto-4-pentenoate hydratase [Alphaproteobacteria bacterium]